MPVLPPRRGAPFCPPLDGQEHARTAPRFDGMTPRAAPGCVIPPPWSSPFRRSRAADLARPVSRALMLRRAWIPRGPILARARLVVAE